MGGCARLGQAVFPAQRGRGFFARRNFDLMLDAGVIREDDGAANSIAKEADNRGIGAPENPQDAAFDTAACSGGSRAQQFDQDAVAVHRVANGVARDKDIPIETGDGPVGDGKAVAVMVEDKAAGDFVAAGGDWLARNSNGSGLSIALSFQKSPLARKAIASARKLLDGTSLFEAGEQFEKGALAGFLELEASCDVARRG